MRVCDEFKNETCFLIICPGGLSEIADIIIRLLQQPSFKSLSEIKLLLLFSVVDIPVFHRKFSNKSYQKMIMQCI